jgi:phosphoglycolate phosphatase-like HAD superfamily hydrolase
VIESVLLDVDGTLVDTTYVHTLCWWQAFRRAGMDVPMVRIHRAIGMGADHLIRHVVGEIGEQDAGGLPAAHDAIYATHWPALRLLPGARELISRCHDEGLVTVLASSAGADELQVLRRLLDADQWLDHATSAADADASKPAPDLVEVALDKAGVPASSTLFIGDSIWDAKACRTARVRCIAVECGGTPAADLVEAGAERVFRDPAELLEHWAELAAETSR